MSSRQENYSTQDYLEYIWNIHKQAHPDSWQMDPRFIPEDSSDYRYSYQGTSDAREVYPGVEATSSSATHIEKDTSQREQENSSDDESSSEYTSDAREVYPGVEATSSSATHIEKDTSQRGKKKPKPRGKKETKRIPKLKVDDTHKQEVLDILNLSIDKHDKLDQLVEYRREKGLSRNQMARIYKDIKNKYKDIKIPKGGRRIKK